MSEFGQSLALHQPPVAPVRSPPAFSDDPEQYHSPKVQRQPEVPREEDHEDSPDVIAFGLSALGTLLKSNDKMPKRLEQWVFEGCAHLDNASKQGSALTPINLYYC